MIAISNADNSAELLDLMADRRKAPASGQLDKEVFSELAVSEPNRT